MKKILKSQILNKKQKKNHNFSCILCQSLVSKNVLYIRRIVCCYYYQKLILNSRHKFKGWITTISCTQFSFSYNFDSTIYNLYGLVVVLSQHIQTKRILYDGTLARRQVVLKVAPTQQKEPFKFIEFRIVRLLCKRCE